MSKGLKTWCVLVKRELDEPAILHIKSVSKPTEGEMQKLFADNGYEDDPECCRFSCREI